MNQRPVTPVQKIKLVARVFVVAMIWVAALSVAGRAQNRLLVPFSSNENFSGDNLGQWASYPPAQDIGYEPSLTPTDDFGAPGGRALMRSISPTRTGDLRMGFIRSVPLVADSSGSIAFAYRISSLGRSSRIEIGLAGSDANRYTKEIPVTTNGWARASVYLRDLRRANGEGLKKGTGIEAVFLIAHIDSADQDTVYRFLIDDIKILAAESARFEIVQPHSLSIAPWSPAISENAYRENETMRLEVRSPVALKSISAAIKDKSGRTVTTATMYDDGTHGDRSSRDGVWTNSAAYRFANSTPAGLWRAEFVGATPDGREVSTVLRFLVRAGSSPAHPNLYFDTSRKSDLIARTNDPRLAKVWEYLKTTAKNTRASGTIAHGGDVFELLDSEYLLPSLLGYFDVLNRARSRISYNAFVSYLTDDAEARQSAKDALLRVSTWQRWEPPWFTHHGQHTYYPAGLLAVDVALGYDLLYDHLTEAERSKIRRALIEKQIIPTYKEYFLDNRAMANTSNWISHTVGGALIAASAIANDVTSEEAGGKFDLYVNGLLMKIEAHMKSSYLPDGSYGEGISYQEFDLESLAPMINAVERAFGVDYWNTTHVKDSLRYALYIRTDPVEASLDMGDTHPPAGAGIAPLVFRSKDPVVRWYYSKFDRPSLQQFIFFDDSVEPKSPDAAGIALSTIFADKGNAVFRTGWGENSMTMLFRAGPNFNHHHADEGSFLITAFGEPLISEAGWSDYYKDPYYATFFTQAVGHNTVLVNGNPESQIIPDTPQFKALDAYPRITDAITSEFYDGVGSDLTSAYTNEIANYTRRIVFIKPHYFVVYDDLRASGGVSTFDLLFHLPDRAGIKTHGAMAQYEGTKAAVGIRSFEPERTLLTIKEGRIPYPVFSTRTPAETPPQPAYVDLKSVTPASRTQFLTAIVPARSSAQASSLMEKMFRLTGELVMGIRVERGTERDIVIFRNGPEGSVMRSGDWSADASVLMVTHNGTGLQSIATQAARLVKNGTRTMFSANDPSSVAVSYKDDIASGAINCQIATKVTLFVPRRPVALSVDGGAPVPLTRSDYDSVASTITFSLPVGRHNFSIRLK